VRPSRSTVDSLFRSATVCAVAALALTACSGSVADRVDGARASAAAAAGTVHTREACLAAHDDLATVGTLAGRLASDPGLRIRLAPQVSAAVGRLSRAVAGSSAEWASVLDATGQLGQALRDANEASVRLTASQVVLAVRAAQAGCALATR
jgi:hypothetical protein